MNTTDIFSQIQKTEQDLLRKKKEESKRFRENFARLLSGEKLMVRHSSVHTAMFDTKNRILEIPNWNDNMSDDLYLLCVTHEVGHALFTPDVEWRKAASKSEDLQHILNVFEDPRIEKLVLGKYPGLRKSFCVGYKELFNSNIKGFTFSLADLHKKNLVDRLNIHFKLGIHTGFQVPFTDEERVWIEKSNKTLTFQDVVELSEEFLKFYQEELKKEQEKKEQEKKEAQEKCDQENKKSENKEDKEKSKKSKSQKQESDEEGDDEDFDLDDEEGDESEEDEDGEESEGKSSKAKSDKEEKSEKKEKTVEVMTEEEFSNMLNEKKNDSEKGEGEAETVDVEFENPDKFKDLEDANPQGAEQPQKEATHKIIVVESQDFLNHVMKSIVDNNPATIPLYVNLPVTTPVSDYVVDYQTVHQEIRGHYKLADSGAPDNQKQLVKAAEDFEKFRNASRKVVNNMATIFEIKKSAIMHSKQRTDKTGVLNMSKIHQYRYNEDIFRKNVTLPEGKNHGLIMIMDLSISMDENMRGTYEQTLNLVLFCKRIGIPFEVYGFTDIHSKGGSDYTSAQPNDMVFPPNYKLRNYLSSRMKGNEFNEACTNMMALVNYHANRYRKAPGDYCNYSLPDTEKLGSTPLNFAITMSANLCRKMREDYNLDILNVIYLTDGDATDNGISVATNETSRYASNKTRNKLTIDSRTQYRTNTVIIRDPITRKEWVVAPDETRDPNNDRNKLTDTLLRVVREVGDVNAICYYICREDTALSVIRDIAKRNNIDATKKVDEFRQTGCFYYGDMQGYSNYYMLKDGEALHVSDGSFSTNNTDTEQQIGEKYQKAMEKLMLSRVFLNKFVENIA